MLQVLLDKLTIHTCQMGFTQSMNFRMNPMKPPIYISMMSIFVLALFCPGPSSSAEVRPVMSPDGRMRAPCRGTWRTDGVDERKYGLTVVTANVPVALRIKTYPGAAGTLGIPAGCQHALVYLERSLRYPAFGSYRRGRPHPADSRKIGSGN